MTKAEIVADLKNMIGPASKGSEVGDAGLGTWVNEAYTRACDIIAEINPDYFRKVVTTSSIADQQEYALPSDFDKIVLVNIKYTSEGTWRTALPMNNINDIPVLSRTDSNQGYTTSSPRYYLSGSNIGFMPIPESAGTNNIKIIYSYVPSELDDTDEPAIPRKFHYELKYWAYANYLNQDDKHNDAENMRRRFEANIERLASSMTERNVDEPKSVIITTGQDLYTDQTQIV